jgi:hypothetical protein
MDIVYAVGRGEAKHAIRTRILKSLSTGQEDGFFVSFGPLDLSIQKVSETNARSLRRDRSHPFKREEVVPEVIQSDSVRTSLQWGEPKRSRGTYGQVERCLAGKVGVKIRQHLAVVGRQNIYSDAVIGIGDNPDFIVR